MLPHRGHIKPEKDLLHYTINVSSRDTHNIIMMTLWPVTQLVLGWSIRSNDQMYYFAMCLIQNDTVESIAIDVSLLVREGARAGSAVSLSVSIEMFRVEGERFLFLLHVNIFSSEFVYGSSLIWLVTNDIDWE